MIFFNSVEINLIFFISLLSVKVIIMSEIEFIMDCSLFLLIILVVVLLLVLNVVLFCKVVINFCRLLLGIKIVVKIFEEIILVVSMGIMGICLIVSKMIKSGERSVYGVMFVVFLILVMIC